MQISKFVPVIGAAILCAGLISARADDNASQAAARAALMEKMNELGNTQAQPSAPPDTNVAPAETQTPAMTAPAQSAPPTETAPPASMNSNDAQAAARAALMQKMNELDNGETQTNSVSNPSPSATLPSVVTGATELTNTAAQTEMQNSTATPPAETSATQNAPGGDVVKGAPIMSSSASSSNYNAAEQAALSQSETNAVVVHTPPPMTPGKTSMRSSSTNSINYSTAAGLGLQPIQAPPPPVTSEQQAQLHALLQRYEADQITPDEYQAERAKIINGQ